MYNTYVSRFLNQDNNINVYIYVYLNNSVCDVQRYYRAINILQGVMCDELFKNHDLSKSRKISNFSFIFKQETRKFMWNIENIEKNIYLYEIGKDIGIEMDIYIYIYEKENHRCHST